MAETPQPQKRGRPPGTQRPNKTQLKESFETLLEGANFMLQMSGSPKAHIFILTEAEIEREAEALTELFLAYPRLYRALIVAQKTGPIANFLIVQWIIFTPRFIKLRELNLPEIEVESENASVSTNNGNYPFP